MASHKQSLEGHAGSDRALEVCAIFARKMASRCWLVWIVALLWLCACDGTTAIKSGTVATTVATAASSAPTNVAPANGASKTNSGSRGTSTATASAGCARRVSLLSKRVSLAMKQDRQGLPGLRLHRDIKLPLIGKDAGAPLKEAPEIMVTKREILVDGNKQPSAQGLVSTLNKKRDLWQSFNPSKKFPALVYVVADAQIKMTRLKPLLKAVHSAGWVTSLLVRGPDSPLISVTIASWVADLLSEYRKRRGAGCGVVTAGMSAQARASLRRCVRGLSQLVEKGIRRASSKCKAVTDVLTRPTAGKPKHDVQLNAYLFSPHRARPELLMRAVKSCDCKLDVDAVEALLVRILPTNNHRFMLLALSKATTAALKSEQTVAELAKQLASS